MSHATELGHWGVGNGRTEALQHWGVGNGRTDTPSSWGVGNGRTATQASWGVDNGRTLEVIDPAGEILAGSSDVREQGFETLEVSFAPDEGFTLPGSYGLQRSDSTEELATFELSEETLADANAAGEVIVVLDARPAEERH